MQKKKSEVRFKLHFIGTKDLETGEFLNPNGKREIHEDMIFACVEKKYTDKALDYGLCRTQNIDSLWWSDCLIDNDIDPAIIKKWAKTDEGAQLLQEKIKLSEELQISYSPLFLLENVEIFGVTAQTTSDEILNLLNSK